ncbi:uncharacterized protein RCO7_10872 [Rhynchosporium graminicola]|uniref:Uncharacterized protein n=1 Tax=Rhynchosporium graminicola TaxID=2792576 RepID=A0A1E1LBJ2_9HELO|nr:uncharacterized protein RCO7_10872 [Rhynchosporium commune]
MADSLSITASIAGISVHATLELLKGVEEGYWKPLGQDIATTIEGDCYQLHSEGKLTWLDLANVRFFKKDQANAMSEQRQSCKLAINLIVGVVTLYSSVRNSHITEEIKKTITIKQGEVQVPSLQQIDSWWLRRS